MEQLMVQYKQVRKDLIKARESLKDLRDQRRAYMAQLTVITTLQNERTNIEKEIALLDKDIKLLSEMISDREYDLEWMETGRRPGNKRGVERLAAYQRERAVDPIRMQAYIAKTSGGGAVQAHTLSDREIDKVEFALGQLSPRERECYELVRGNGFSYGETANLLGLEKSTIQWFVEAADTKLRHHINQADLFDYL
ncbi:sigma factor-like helix-turn-helix DNA-binding protein [Paenibacillus sp. UMB4589-SE434]|nr:sigma factor-like helix-turn-helix DNA-binding protein [Paenibacillus sp. UMB4589-SE434]